MSDDLAAAELTLRSYVRKQPHDPLTEEIGVLLAEYDRMRAELVILREKRRSREHSIAELTFLRCENERAEAHLARALPIVEAAETLVDERYYHPEEGSEHADSNQAHYETLEAAVLAARALDARKGQG